jgi:hypothetical protein
MKYLKSYNNFTPINEALGIAEATLIYNDFLGIKFKEKFDDWYLKTTQKGGLKKEKVSESFKVDDLGELIMENDWVKFPVSSINVTYEFEIITDIEFNKKFPKTAKHQGHVSYGACFNIMDKKEGGSYIKEPIDDRTDSTIHLELELGTCIRESFSDEELLIVEVESLITHELNHAYENWNRFKKGAPNLSTDVTWAIDANRAKVKKLIFKEWYSKVGYFLYWSELHEMRAMVQEAWPYVKKYPFEKMKQVSPVWRNITDMENFRAEDFKEHMTKFILATYPDADPELMLKRIKSGVANQLIKSREESILEMEDSPSISGEDVHKMSVDQFLKFVEDRAKRAAEKMKSKIIKLYSKEGAKK